MDVLHLTSTTCSSPVPCSYLPIFYLFLEGAQKPREYGECQMLQLDRYWSLDIWIDCSKRFTEDRSNPISWFRPFALCCHPRCIFQVLFLCHIVDSRLQKSGVFVMVAKQPKYKGDVASFVALPCLFCNPLLHNRFHLILYFLVNYINLIDWCCLWSCLSIVLGHCFWY